MTLMEMNRFEEALKYYDFAIQIGPENSECYHCKAITLFKMKKFDEALNYYDLAI